METIKIVKQVIILLFSFIVLYACSSIKDKTTEEKEQPISLSVSENVNTVIRIRRILLEAGIVNLASEEAGIVSSVKKKIGR